MHNFHPTTVCKIMNGYSLKVFDTAKFGEVRRRRPARVDCRRFSAAQQLHKRRLQQQL